MTDMMLAGLMKRRIENYKEIVITLLNKQKLSENQKQFLTKEKVLQ